MLDPVPYDLSKVTLINNKAEASEWTGKNFKLIYATPNFIYCF